jgi:hypothetical protein
MKAIGITTVNSYDEIMQADGVVEAHANFEGLDPDRIVREYTA